MSRFKPCQTPGSGEFWFTVSPPVKVVTEDGRVAVCRIQAVYGLGKLAVLTCFRRDSGAPQKRYMDVVPTWAREIATYRGALDVCARADAGYDVQPELPRTPRAVLAYGVQARSRAGGSPVEMEERVVADLFAEIGRQFSEFGVTQPADPGEHEPRVTVVWNYFRIAVIPAAHGPVLATHFYRCEVDGKPGLPWSPSGPPGAWPERDNALLAKALDVLGVERIEPTWLLFTESE